MNLQELRQGDRVVLSNKSDWYDEKNRDLANPINIQGTVITEDCTKSVRVKWDNHTTNSYSSNNDLELVSSVINNSYSIF